QLLIGHEILLAFREPEIRFGTIVQRQIPGRDSERALIDLDSVGLEIRLLGVGLVDNSRWRLIADAIRKTSILGADHAGVDETSPGVLAADATESGFHALDPRRNRQAKPRDG